MATKKASSAKSSSSKKTASKIVTPVAEVVEVATKNVEKLTIGEKAAALRPGALIAEFLGTFVLAGAVLNLASAGAVGSVAVALILAILVVVFGAISGAHLNPAITIAQWVNKKIDGVKAVAYIFAQVIGALAAFGLLLGVFNATIEDKVLTKTFEKYGVSLSEAETQLNASGQTLDKWVESQGGIDALKKSAGIEFTHSSVAKGQEGITMLLEFIGAIIFGLGVGYAVFAVKKSQIEAGLAVGLGLLGGLIVGGTAVILNPAVAAALGAFEWVNPFGSTAMTFWWPILVYILATTAGMTAGVTLYRVIAKDAK